MSSLSFLPPTGIYGIIKDLRRVCFLTFSVFDTFTANHAFERITNAVLQKTFFLAQKLTHLAACVFVHAFGIIEENFEAFLLVLSPFCGITLSRGSGKVTYMPHEAIIPDWPMAEQTVDPSPVQCVTTVYIRYFNLQDYIYIISHSDGKKDIYLLDCEWLEPIAISFDQFT